MASSVVSSAFNRESAQRVQLQNKVQVLEKDVRSLKRQLKSKEREIQRLQQIVKEYYFYCSSRE